MKEVEKYINSAKFYQKKEKATGNNGWVMVKNVYRMLGLSDH